MIFYALFFLVASEAREAFSQPVITDIVPNYGYLGQSMDVTIIGTGFGPETDVKLLLSRGNTQIGAFGVWDVFWAENWMLGAPSLEVTRNVLNAWDLPSSVQMIKDRFEDFNHSESPIELVYTLRWPYKNDLGELQDTPPEITDPGYLNVRQLLIDLLDEEGSEAQEAILNQRLRITFFNEVCGGPGTIVSELDHYRALNLATDLITSIRQNVANGHFIKFSTAALTSAHLVHPNYDPGNDPSRIARQARMRNWIEWASAYDATVDVHLQIASLDDPNGIRDFTRQIEAIEAYADSLGWDHFQWGSGECGPTHFPVVDYDHPTQQELELAEAFEYAFWIKAFEYRPQYLLRTPFFEHLQIGQPEIWSSIMYNDCPFTTERNDPCPKQPFASILAYQLSLPFEDPDIDVDSVLFVNSKELRASLTIGSQGPATFRDIRVENPGGNGSSLKAAFLILP